MVKKKKKTKKEKNKAHTKTAPEFAVKKDLNFNTFRNYQDSNKNWS